MLRLATRKHHVKNEDIWREANVEPMTTFLRKKRLRWYGNVLRKEGKDTTLKMLNMQVQGKRRWLDNIRGKICLCYVIGGPYVTDVSDQAGLNRGPLILNLFIVTLYTLFVRIE